MLGSIGAGALSSPFGIFKLFGSARSALCGTVTFVLYIYVSIHICSRQLNKDLQRDFTRLRLARDQLLPCFGALSHNLHCVFLVLALAGEGKLVLWLSVGDLVNPEPLVCCPQQSRQVSFHILDVVQLRCQRVVDIDDHDLPVCLALVEKRHHAQDFHLLDLAGFGDELADLTDIERIVVTFLLRLGVGDVGVFPSLREGAVVPKVAFVREAVANKT